MVTPGGGKSAKKRRRWAPPTYKGDLIWSKRHINTEVSSGSSVCSQILLVLKMQQSTLVAVIFGAFALLLTTTSAAVISCPPNDIHEASPSLRRLCYAIEQAIITDNSVPDETSYRRIMEREASPLAERNVNPNAKRQDVDHVFLRFGRRFGL